MVKTLTGTIILDQSGPGSNSNKEVTAYFPTLQNKCSLVSYQDRNLMSWIK